MPLSGRGLPSADAGFGWLCLGALAAWQSAGAGPWILGVGALWSLGAFLMARMPRERWNAAAGSLAAAPWGRVGLVWCGALAFVSAALFGVEAAVLAIIVVGVISLATVRWAAPEGLAQLFSGLALLGTSLLAAAGAGEWVLGHTRYSGHWGSPSELASWEDRYDSLANPRSLRWNVFGFRSPHEELRAPDGTYRVLALGDSFTWGDKIAATQNTWPAVLERLLAELYPERRFEVVNTAMRGYTTANEVELLERIGWQLRPDVVVLQWLANDAFPSRAGLGALSSGQVFGRARLLPARFRQGPAGRSALLAFLEDRLNRILIQPDFAPLYEADSEGWVQAKAALQRLAAGAAERNVPALLVVTPRLLAGPWSGETHSDRAIHEEVLAVARAGGLATADLTHAFGDPAAGGERWWATPYDSHPGEAAHRLIAEEVLAALLSLAILDANQTQGEP